ncbi:MAG: hypothetical protein LRY50_07515 [Geovibrio sp.]|nr:hypothetical protein [Geovibrio sp.]
MVFWVMLMQPSTFKNNTDYSLIVQCKLDNGTTTPSSIGLVNILPYASGVISQAKVGTGCPNYNSPGLITCNYTNSDGAQGYFKFYACPVSGATTCQPYPSPSSVENNKPDDYFPYACPAPGCATGTENQYKTCCGANWIVCSHDCTVTNYVVVNAKNTYLLTWTNIKASLTKGQVMSNKVASYLKNNKSVEIVQSVYHHDNNTNTNTMSIKFKGGKNDEDPFANDQSLAECSTSIS